MGAFNKIGDERVKFMKGDHEVKSIKVYAGYNMNQDVRLSSSSGAIFSLLAENVLSQKGTVYGVKMSDDCYSAVFTRVTDIDGLIWLRGSKYLQAKVGNTYKQVKDDLLAGKLVLFSGTGCQVNGLKNFLGKEYDTVRRKYEHNIAYHASRYRQPFWNRNQTVGAGGCVKSYHHGLLDS